MRLSAQDLALRDQLAAMPRRGRADEARRRLGGRQGSFEVRDGGPGGEALGAGEDDPAFLLELSHEVEPAEKDLDEARVRFLEEALF